MSQVVNITKQNAMMENNVLRRCDYKCSYSFNYPETNVVATNNGILLTLTCDNYNNSPATFNAKKYNVNSMMIFAPSLHLFNGVQVAAEIIIEHSPTQGGSYFYVCVPVIENYNTSPELAAIITQVSTQAAEQGDSINFNKTEFTLQSIVPMKPYYFYNGYFATNEGSFIVYDESQAIGLDQATLTALTSVIQPNALQMTGGSLSFNTQGPQNQQSGQIYISCKPTGSSSETTTITNQKTNSSSSSFSSSSFKTWLIAIAVILFIVLLAYGATKFLGHGAKTGGTSLSIVNPTS